MKYRFQKLTAACLALLILLSALPISALATGESAPVGWDGTVADGYESGTGTAEDPYVIVNGAQLAYFSAQVDSGEAYEGVYFELAADIALNDITDWELWGTTDENGYTVAPANVWEPIGHAYNDRIFSGSFDGKGHTISGIYINGNQDDVALFSGLGGGAVLKNVHVAASYVKGDENVAALVGSINYPSALVTVSGCSAAGIVTARYDCGGIVGYADAYYKDCIAITECINRAAVTSKSDIAGGIVATAYKAAVISCTNNGAVKGDSETGGIVGYASDSEVDSCINNGSVSGEYIGGIIGRVYKTTVTTCVNTADLVSDGYVGGIAQQLQENSVVRGCRNTGDITGNSVAAGICASASAGVIEECENYGAVVSPESNAAGVVGSVYGSWMSNGEYSTAAVVRCANYGSVSGMFDISGIGKLDSAVAKECVNFGDVTAQYYAAGMFIQVDDAVVSNCYNAGSVMGDYRGSGFAGAMNDSTITSCYTKGVVLPGDYEYSDAYPFASDADTCSLTGCYYLYQTVEDNHLGEFLAEEDAVLADSYENYDFLSVWETGYDEDYAYPTLRFFGSNTYQYRITYVDGGNVVKTALVEDGEPLDLTSPENDEYIFAYWKDEDGKRYSVTDTVSATANVTLTAVWMVRNTSANVWDGSVDIEWAGSGTKDDPYLIGNPAELAGLSLIIRDRAAYSDLYYDVWDAYFTQTADFLMNDGGDRFGETMIGQNEWTPISGDFSGRYDGGGHTIRGVYINTDAGSCGVFGMTYADISNLILKDSYIYSSDGLHIGGIAGRAGIIQDCENYATVIGDDYVGGVAGYASKTLSCTNYGDVRGEQYVGGVVGYSTDENDGMSACVNYGTVCGDDYVGGTVGRAYFATDCGNEGVVNGNRYVGGVVGQASRLKNCVNSGTVSGVENVGGVVAYGEDICGAVNHGNVSGDSNVGGAIGMVNDIAENNYSTGNVVGRYHVGGVAGYISWEAALSTSYAVGTVTAVPDTDERYVGGVIGDMSDDAVLTDCYYLDTALAESNDYGTALTAQQMQTEAAFGGFNFLKTWEFGFESDYPYPTLRDMGSKEYRYKVIMINEGEIFADRTYYMGVQVNLKPPASSTYDFAYWRAEDGTRYAADDVIKASEDLTLTAIWQTRPNGYAWDGAVDTDWLGSGTEEDPYLISTPAEFVGIAAKMEEVWWEDFEGVYFKQTADFVMNADGDQFSDTISGRLEWSPIEGFAGNYDGDGHSISGVYINSYTRAAALFSSICGTLKNLTLTDSYIVSHYSNAGGFAIEIDGLIENCRNEAYVCSTVNKAGGIAANVWATEGEPAVVNCSNTGAVIGYEWVGGIVADQSDGVISGCSNSGYVSAGADDARFVGGIVGSSYDDVENCLNSGIVEAVHYVGGIAGDTTSNMLVTGCINVGTVLGLNRVGGIVGDNSATVTNCYNSGIVSFDSACFEERYSGNYIGGIVGTNDGALIGVYNTGDVIGGVETSYIGGIVGYNWNTLREAYSIGTVTTGENGYGCGAIVGENNGAAESAFYADSSAVTDNWATALTAEQMKTAEAYTGFDFDTNWTIDPTNEDYPYPTLTGAPHKQYVTVTFADPNGNEIASYRLEKGAVITYPDMSRYNYEDSAYVYEFDAWDKTPTVAAYDITITATFKKVAKLFFTSIEKQLTVGYGYSATNLQIDLESLYAQIICSTTTDYRLLSDVVWDIEGYDPTVAGEVVLNGYLMLTENPYYEMAEGATVTVTVTVLGEGDTTHIFEANDLRFETLSDGTLKVIGYDGEAQVVHIPQSISGKAVTIIGENAFADADVLSVTLPSTVHTVETGAFENASSLSMVVLPDSLHTVGERAFYNTALADVTCPAALVNIGAQAFGYYGAAPTAVGGFTVYAFADTAAASYATENGFICVATQTAVDDDTDVSAVIPENLSLAVVAVDEGDYYDTAAGIFTEIDGVKLMDISLYDGELSVQPGGVMTVSMPIPEGFNAENCHIFRINDDGSYKDMAAEIVGDRLVFSTAHLSVYAVIEQHEDSVLVGDVTGDGALGMRDALKLYQIASSRIQNDMPLDIADLTGDGDVNMRDALKLYQIVSAGQ